MKISLEEFRSNLEDQYNTVLASDHQTWTRLVMQTNIEYACGSYGTYFLVKGPTVNIKTQSLAEATRHYWEIVYDD